MLARANRLVAADDYRRLVRRGRKSSTSHAVIYTSRGAHDGIPRFGFIVAKTVGVAVDRNLVRRRLKAVAYESLGSGMVGQLPAGTDIVIRALPGAAQADWATLRSEISEALMSEALRSEALARGGRGA